MCGGASAWEEPYSSSACDGTWANAKDIGRLAIHAPRWNDSAVPCAMLTMTCWLAPGDGGGVAGGGGDGDASSDEDGDVTLCMVD